MLYSPVNGDVGFQAAPSFVLTARTSEDRRLIVGDLSDCSRHQTRQESVIVHDTLLLVCLPDVHIHECSGLASSLPTVVGFMSKRAGVTLILPKT